MPTHSGGDGDGGRRGGAGTPSESLNEQIVVALARLQEDMQNVLERLHTLEALTASQVRHAATRHPEVEIHEVLNKIQQLTINLQKKKKNLLFK